MAVASEPMAFVAVSFFGGASALQFSMQALGLDVPHQFFLALPYLSTLAALAGWMGRARAASALAHPWPKASM